MARTRFPPKKRLPRDQHDRYHDNWKRFGWRKKLLLMTYKDKEIYKKVLERQLFLPKDPMRWTEIHVMTWVRDISVIFQFNVDLNLFVMNGKGICLMSLEGFRYRSPVGGALLYNDLQHKLLANIMTS
ncbi:transforming protein p54/c-ets-1 [Ciona intestinalis]